jgi:predicted nucleic-acid-binding Zn-ribbon protein
MHIGNMFGKKEPKSYEVLGKVLKCQVCGHDEFSKREAQLNTAGMSFVNLDWANASAVCFVCEQCGYIHWFLPK